MVLGERRQRLPALQLHAANQSAGTLSGWTVSTEGFSSVDNIVICIGVLVLLRPAGAVARAGVRAAVGDEHGETWYGHQRHHELVVSREGGHRRDLPLRRAQPLRLV